VPLPVLLGRGRCLAGLPRRSAQRAARRCSVAHMVAEAAAAINALAGARAGGELTLPRGLSDLDLSRCSDAQLRAGRRLRQGVVENFPPPGDLKKEEALKELLHADDLYAVKRLTALAAYDPTKLRVTKADLAPKEIEDLVSPEARALAEDPDKFIIKDDAELADDVDHGRLPGRPCWDPVLRHNTEKKRSFSSCSTTTAC